WGRAGTGCRSRAAASVGPLRSARDKQPAGVGALLPGGFRQRREVLAPERVLVVVAAEADVAREEEVVEVDLSLLGEALARAADSFHGGAVGFAVGVAGGEVADGSWLVGDGVEHVSHGSS